MVYWKTRARTGGHGHGQLWKRRAVMEKTDTKHLKPIF